MKELNKQELISINGGWGWSSFKSAVKKAASVVGPVAGKAVVKVIDTIINNPPIIH